MEIKIKFSSENYVSDRGVNCLEHTHSLGGKYIALNLEKNIVALNNFFSLIF